MRTAPCCLTRLASAGTGLLGMIFLVACAAEQPLPNAPDLVAARAASTSDPTVESVDPNNAPQDTTLDVRVFGSRYEPGSRVDFLLDGNPTRNIKTNGTRFVSSTELIANITIALDADTALYDVRVTTSDGRKGIGIELFKVRGRWENVPNLLGPPVTVTFRDASTDNIRSDGRVLTSDGRGIYVDRECAVTATFNGTDARLDPDDRKIHPSEATACGGREPRSVKFTLQPTAFSARFAWDGTTQDGSFFKVNEVELVTEADGTVPRTVKALVDWCDLRFNPNLDPNSSFVDVTKNPDGTWSVASRAHPDNVGVCLNSDPTARLYYHLPFAITVRLK